MSTRHLLFGLGLLLVAGPAAAQSHLMIEGLLRDNAGKPLDGTFDLTFSLYEAETGGDPVYTEVHTGAAVEAGLFQERIGGTTAIDPKLFRDHEALWLGVTLSGQPELPRTPLEADPYAFRALTAASAGSLDCTGCIDATHVAFPYAAAAAPGGDAKTALVAKDLSCTGCIKAEYLQAGLLAAANVTFDDSVAKLDASNVQAALERLKVLVDKAASGGGGTGGPVNEGNGTIVPYVEQWALPAFGKAVEYIHLLNPAKPKVAMYMYGGENTGFAAAGNLVVASDVGPNRYTGAVSGTKGQDTLQIGPSGNPSNFAAGDHILIHQTVGSGAGNWELNVVTGVTGSSLKLGKPLANTYVSATGNTPERAQVVRAASYNQLEVVSGGQIRPYQALSNGSTDNFYGGIVYIRAQAITVKSGGTIMASGPSYGGFYNGDGTSSPWCEQGESECKTGNLSYTNSPNCSGGGGGYYSCTSCSCTSYAAGGGGNKTAGQAGKGGGNNGQGGTAKGDADATTIHFGGGGGRSYAFDGGRGGGIVVLGAKTIIVESGGRIEANGANASASTNCQVYAGSGGGAGGSVVLFGDTVQNNGTIEAKGGTGGDGYSDRDGGDGGEGWVITKQPIPGSVNQTYATGVQIWVDGVNVTPSVGDPNGKGSPHWDAVKQAWGATGTEPWSTGQLNLTSVANWTLGEHKIELKETGGAGGDLKGYFYVLYPFTESKPPANDTCSAAQVIDPNTEPVVVSGTTEDTMGKTLAKDDSNLAGCGGDGGPDVVYQIDLKQRSLLNVSLVAPFSSKLYLLKDDCAAGTKVWCADQEFTTNPIEPGTYFLWVDSDLAAAKGDFTLGVSTTPAPLPENDTCATAMKLVIGPTGTAQHQGTNLYSLDDYKGLCPAAKTGGPDVVYELTAGTGQTLNVNLTAGFKSIMYLTTQKCGNEGIPISCSASGSLTVQGLGGGTYWLVIDGEAEKEWGPYTLDVELQ